MNESKNNNSNGMRVILLGCPGDVTCIIYNYLSREVKVHKVFIERSRTRGQIIKSKLRDFGYLATFGQILFAFTAKNVLEAISKVRKKELKSMPSMDLTPVPEGKTAHVDSVNSKAFRKQLRELQPDVIVVNGTRILGKRTLQCTKAPFINIHPGITPRFRGLHTGYWAMIDNPKAVGVTVHLVDPGVDTGGILGQTTVMPSKRDNLATFSLLQVEAGLPLLLKAVKDSLAGCSQTKKPMLASESKLWTHPTLWGYLWNLIRFGVK